MKKEVLKAIKDSKDLIMESMGIPLDQYGIEALDMFIERLTKKYAESDEEFQTAIVFRVGSFLGEAIIENYGGEWRQIGEHYVIGFDPESKDKNIAYVFSKVVKRFENGEEDSLLSFYEMIPEVFDKKLLKNLK